MGSKKTPDQPEYAELLQQTGELIVAGRLIRAEPETETDETEENGDQQ